MAVVFLNEILILNCCLFSLLDFMKSEEGQGFTGQVCIVADSVGSVLAYDALCRATKYQSRHGSENSILDSDVHNKGEFFQIKKKLGVYCRIFY